MIHLSRQGYVSCMNWAIPGKSRPMARGHQQCHHNNADRDPDHESEQEPEHGQRSVLVAVRCLPGVSSRRAGGVVSRHCVMARPHVDAWRERQDFRACSHAPGLLEAAKWPLSACRSLRNRSCARNHHMPIGRVGSVGRSSCVPFAITGPRLVSAGASQTRRTCERSSLG
jgi:hypothetical protein